MPKKDLGRVHVYTGLGKGKTTSALGLAMRAIGHGYNATVIRFMVEHKEPGEWRLQRKLKGQLTVLNYGEAGSNNLHNSEPSAMDVYMAKQGLEEARKLVSSKKAPDVLILDEINPAIYAGLLKPKEVVDFLKNTSKSTEIVLTGSFAHPDVVKAADIVTEMKPLKQDEKGLRPGIEF